MDRDHLGVVGCWRVGNHLSHCHSHQTLEHHQREKMSKKPFTKEEFEDLIDERVGERIRELIDSGELAKGLGPIPSGIITISGGSLSKETIERMQEFMEEAVKNLDMSKILILEPFPDVYGVETTIKWIPMNKGKPPPIIQLHENRTTATVISGDIEEVREILRRDGSVLPGLKIDEG